MEVLAPLDDRQFPSHPHYYPRHHTAPSSRNSPDRMQPSHIGAYAERPTPSYELPQPTSGSRQSPRQLAAFPPMGSNKPSLPPIRALLGEPLASPPATPNIHHHGHTESEYTHQHKRSCSTLAWERRSSTHASPTSVHSASLPYMDGPYRRDSAIHDLPAYRHPEDPYARTRLGNTFLPELARPSGQPSYQGKPLPSPDRGRMPPEPSRKRSFDSISGHPERERLMPSAPWAPVPRGPAPAYHPATPPPPPPSFRPYSASGAHMPRPHIIEGRSMVAPMHSGMQVGSPAHVPGIYQRPGVYDYHLSKSRKRSNLPKESTDIMKRWFEAHLDNPYPSEEDKKHFADAAGINLTQVSNWFINHRRRCPELREQRDKKHTTGGRTPTTSP